MFKKQDKNFVSELDVFLHQFDQQHPEKSASQQAEIDKHQYIAKLRDNKEREEGESLPWSDF